MNIARSTLLTALIASLTLAGCATQGNGGANATGISSLPVLQPQSSSPIKHIVIVVQENRSFDNIFALYPGAQGASQGKMSNGTTTPLHAINFNTDELSHIFNNSIQDSDHGAMDKFDLNQRITKSGLIASGTYNYAYLSRTLVAPYWSMAHQYVLADAMFPTEHGASFTGHLDLIAGTTNLSPTLAEADTPTEAPWGCDAPPGTPTFVVNAQRQVSRTGPFPCFTQFKSIASVLDPAGVSWKYYVPTKDPATQLWSAFDAIKAVRYNSRDWPAKIAQPQTTVLTDAAAGTLPAVSWVIPTYADSDHAGNNSDTGPSWVAAVVNAIGTSSSWDSTAIVVVWDDWGGWYDNLAPPQLDFAGLGIRVPCLIISPYSKSVGYVSHTQYEFGSILKFIEETYHLPSLGYSDARANSLSDSFNFNQAPRPFVKIKAKYPARHFLLEKPSNRNPDDV